jgi:hypothetical protein
MTYSVRKKEQVDVTDAVDDDNDADWEDIPDDEGAPKTSKKKDEKSLLRRYPVVDPTNKSLLTMKNYDVVSPFHLMARSRIQRLVETFLTTEPYRSELEAQTWVVGDSTLG